MRPSLLVICHAVWMVAFGAVYYVLQKQDTSLYMLWTSLFTISLAMQCFLLLWQKKNEKNIQQQVQRLFYLLLVQLTDIVLVVLRVCLSLFWWNEKVLFFEKITLLLFFGIFFAAKQCLLQKYENGEYLQ